MRGLRGDGRFRRRLTVAFILVAATAAGVLAVSSFILIREYRMRSFVERSREKAALSLIAAPERLDIASAQALVGEYRQRGGFETVVVAGEVVFSSLPSITRADVPERVARNIAPGALTAATAEVRGEPTLVIGGASSEGGVETYFFFSRQALLESIDAFRDVLLIGWITSVLGAALLGNLVARRTLRPVAEAASASQALAEGLLNTRLERGTDDEFGQWAASFNTMAAALQDKLDALSTAAARERRLTADVAHELRTPLTGMVSAASLLEDTVATMDADAAAAATLLIDDVHRLHALVVELLELARFDAGEERADLEVLSVRQSLLAVCRGWDAARRVEVDAPEDLYVLADRVRFRRVVGNLVSNAVEHGGGEVVVSARGEVDRVAIEVCDDGPGIQADEAARVFERFYKGDPSRSATGSGLGLAIALENARLQGGSISVRNRDDGGACFRFELTAPDERPDADAGTRDADVRTEPGDVPTVTEV